MIDRTSFLCLVTAVAFVFALALKAQSNAPASLILPPPDWDVQKHKLASLVATNRPGNYPLQPPWVGVERVTAKTGWFATKGEKATQTNQGFKFDRLIVCPGLVLPVMREDRYICETATGPGPAYRPSLPTDSELLGMHDVASVTNFFGWNPFKHDSDHGSAVGIRYFTLGPYNSIQTLYVRFQKKAQSSDIDSVIVRRGRFRPE